MHSMVFDLCAVITNVNINSKLSERSRCNMAMHLLVLNHIRLRHKLIKRNSVISKFYLLACTEAGIEATAWARVGWKCGADLEHAVLPRFRDDNAGDLSPAFPWGMIAAGCGHSVGGGRLTYGL